MKKLVQSLFIVLLLVTTVMAQDRVVKGVVTAAEDGLPLPGVSVSVKGTTSGTQTNANGQYSLKITTSNPVLVFSFIGTKTQELAVPASNTLNVKMVSDAEQLSEVVVTALGVSKAKKSIGYSYSTVSGDDLVKSGESNVIQGLAAKASGVQVTSSSGTPGASSKIILRGPASFSGDNQPLIVIDGVPINNDVNNITAGDDPYNGNLAGVQLGNRALDINPEDIESVTVLKGPAAAALYGQAAGNGAIVYTTKRGKFGQGLGVVYSSSAELEKVNKLPELQSRYGQGKNGVYDSDEPNSWGEDLLATNRKTFNNMEDFFQTGSTFNNNIAISSGNEKGAFRLSVGSTNSNGIVPFSKMNRYTARLSADSKLSDFLSIGGTFGYTNSNVRNVQNGSNLAGVMLGLLRMPAEFDGSDYIDEHGNQKTFYGAYDNPWYSVRSNPYTSENDRVTGNVYADAKLNDVFTVTWRTGIDAYSTKGTQIYAVGSNGDDNSEGYGEIKRTNVDFRNVYSDLLLKFKTEINKDFSVSGLLGGNINYNQFLKNFGRGRNLSIPEFYNFKNAKDLYVSNEETYRNSKAVFLDATFDYRSIVFLTLTGRNEWSTTFGKKSKGFFYPKADLSYVFSHLLDPNSILSYGKVRFAYSNVGISPDVYTDRTYYTTPFIADGMTNGFSFPYLGQVGYSMNEELNADGLKPERNTGYEMGLELQFFKNRLGFDGTYYHQKSKDLLISQPVDPATGYAYYYSNVGEMENKGIEIGLRGDIIKKKDFGWSMNVNWSKNKSNVLELAPGVEKLSIGSAFASPQSYAIVGNPFGVLYATAYKRDGNGNMLINPATGLPEFEEELQNVGSPIPDWLMNINNQFIYKNWSFSFLWDIRQGGKIWGGTQQTLINRGRAKMTEDRDRNYIVDGVYASGPNAGQKNTTEISGFTYFTNYYTAGELGIQDGSWVRLRSVDLSYKFDKLGALSKGIQYIKVGASARNLLLFTDYIGVDPETSLTGSDQNFAGYDFYNNPGTKSFSINLRVGF
ncbi:SusC/RagA family TonB-linked outer membrane protein [Pseudopedobacter beijingensis]|uniref:SusC/RagA family TonB-linked outer membrane protein n=1 Tax=Pseudopedobacter beijingensis TaxID=1207056 RepID=A0ABW4ICD7_9SPHI